MFSSSNYDVKLSEYEVIYDLNSTILPDGICKIPILWLPGRLLYKKSLSSAAFPAAAAAVAFRMPSTVPIFLFHYATYLNI